MVYCDTDSIKYIGDYDFVFNDYNSHIQDPLKLGHYEKDRPFKYDRFKTYGAKKYAYEIDGKISITVAGVPKKGADELNGLEDFTINKRFTKTGKKRLVYNGGCMEYKYKFHNIFVTSNCTLIDTEYTLDITKEYKNLIIELFKKEKIQ